MLRAEARAIRRGANVRSGGFLGIELKFYDTLLVGSALTTATDASGGEHDPSATIVLNSVIRDTSESGRIGNRITMKNISLNGIINVPIKVDQTTSDVAPVVFISLVMDKQTNGATIASEDVYTNKGANILLGASLYRNLQETTRFRVLRSMQLTLPQPTLTFDGTNLEQGGFQIPWRMDVPLNQMVQFNAGTTESVANITDNSLHLLAWASSTTLNPTISYNSRLRFVG